MNPIYIDVKIDTCRSGMFGGCAPIYAKQGDYNSRIIRITMLDHGKRLVISSDADVTMNVMRPDGRVAVLEGSVDDEGRVTIPLKLSAVEANGKAKCDVSVVLDGFKLSTVTVPMFIEEAAVSDDQMSLDEDVDFLRKLIAQTEVQRLSVDSMLTVVGEYSDRLEELIGKAGAVFSGALGTFRFSEHNELAARFDEMLLYPVNADSYRLFDFETDTAIGDAVEIGEAMYLPKLLVPVKMKIRYYQSGVEIMVGNLDIKRQSDEPYAVIGEIRNA